MSPRELPTMADRMPENAIFTNTDKAVSELLIDGDLDLRHSDITKLPKTLSVDGNFFCFAIF